MSAVIHLNKTYISVKLVESSCASALTNISYGVISRDTALDTDCAMLSLPHPKYVYSLYGIWLCLHFWFNIFFLSKNILVSCVMPKAQAPLIIILAFLMFESI